MRYSGLHLHGDRVVLSYTIGSAVVHESPWLEETADATALTRTLIIGPAKVALKMLVADPKARVRLHPRSESASVAAGHGVVNARVVVYQLGSTGDIEAVERTLDSLTPQIGADVISDDAAPKRQVVRGKVTRALLLNVGH